MPGTQPPAEPRLPTEHVVRDDERQAFQHCRRAWDLGSRARRNLVPSTPDAATALDRALHEALSVYYFPGMWGWDRSIVRPLSLKALRRSLAIDTVTSAGQTTARSDGPFRELEDRAVALLEDYFDWAPGVDDFEPLRVTTEFDVQVADPHEPDRDLVAIDGGSVHYRGRVDLLMLDHAMTTWVADHRLVANEFASLDELIRDRDLTSKGWAWQRFALATRIAGTVYNEISETGSEPVANDQEAALDGIVRFGTERFRRTWIPRDQASLAAVGETVGRQAVDMTDPGVAVYPNPSPATCPTCPYRSPCRSWLDGADPEPLLTAAYRIRLQSDVEPGRLGSVTWSMGRGAAPPQFGRDRAER